MKRNSPINLISILALLACTGCGAQMPSFMSTHTSDAQPQVPQQNAATSAVNPGYAMDNQGCSGTAQKRMSMYDRPDTYPISDAERKDAYQALYSECMREHNWQIAGPVHTPVNDAGQFANLSPAAGGNMAQQPTGTTVNAGNTIVSSSQVPGATVIVIGGNKESNAAQLSSLSPSAGGNGSSNPTVVMVQSQQPQMQPNPYAANYYAAPVARPTGPLPVAVPVAPPQMAKAAAPQPAAAVAAPAQNAYAPAAGQPSLAGADATVLGTTSGKASSTLSASATSAGSQGAAQRELENVLEQ